jgi:hypothetical protein
MGDGPEQLRGPGRLAQPTVGTAWRPVSPRRAGVRAWVRSQRSGMTRWRGRGGSRGGKQGDKVPVRASSRGGGLTVGHVNGAGNSPLGWRDREGGRVGRGGAFADGETLQQSSVPLCGSCSKVRRRGK